jgi:hypothetical protein
MLARLLACGVASLCAQTAPALQAARPAPDQQDAVPAVQRDVIEIEHTAPACVAAGKYSRLAACFRPASQLARARVYFRAGGTAGWFYVEMTPDAACYQAVLPRVRKQVARVEYYISATDRRSSESRTADGSLRVSADGRCAEGPLAPVSDSGSVVIGSLSGAAPAGFVTGGGLSPLLVLGGVAVVGGGVAAIVAKGGSKPAATTTTTTTFRSNSTRVRSVAWQSDLQLDGGRGQVVVDGAEAVFPSAGPASFFSASGPGAHRFEATVVDARSGRRDGGGAGTWRFDLSALRPRAGSLRVVAGDVAELAADAVAFRLRGRSGERVVFVFEIAAP